MNIKPNRLLPPDTVRIVRKKGTLISDYTAKDLFGYRAFVVQDIQEVQLPDLSIWAIACLARIKAEPDVSMGSFYNEEGYERGYNPLELYGEEEIYTYLKDIAEGKITSGKVVEELQVLISKFSALPFHGAAELAADCLLDSLKESLVES